MTPSRWRSERLKHVADVTFSGIDKKSVDGEVPVRLCNYTDVYHNAEITADLPFLEATASPDQVRSFGLREGDVVITKDSETADDIGVAAFVPETLGGVVCGYHLAMLRPQLERVDPRYLFWSMCSSHMREQMSTVASGVTRYGLRFGDTANLQLFVPDLARQHAVAQFLDHETARIDRLISQKRRLDQLAEERLRASITTLTTLRDTPRAPLGRFIAGIDQGYSPVCDVDRADVGWGVLKLSAVHRGRFRPSENKAMRPDELVREEYRLAAGDVLVTRANTPELVGDVCLVRGNPGRVLLPDLIYRLRLRAGLDPRFLVYVLLSGSTRRFIESIARGSSQSMVKLRAEDLRSLLIPVSREGEQREIADQLDSLTSWRDRLVGLIEKQVRVLQERRQALITAAATGQMDVSNEVAVTA